MDRKCILVVCDGLGDRPIKEFGNKTPLEDARTPNLDKLASHGQNGIMNAIGIGIAPGSDTSHLAILGYDPKEYYTGRGVFECAGVGAELKEGDIAFRANLGTVNNLGVITDRRAGRIDSTAEFIKELNGTKINGIEFILKPGTAHRVALMMRGKGLSSAITDNDPHVTGEKPKMVLPKDRSKEAKFTADTLNKFLELAQKKLSENPENKRRERAGKLPANYLLCRGAAHKIPVPSFESRFGLRGACIAGTGLYKGVAAILGMDILDVKGATGKPDTNIQAKFVSAKKALDKYDFVFVHIKAADNLGEDGNFRGKKEFIEKIDLAARELLDLKDTLVVITADHSTPCEMKAHSGDPVPITFSGNSVRVDRVSKFSEKDCACGIVGRIKGTDVVPEILNLLGKAKLYGA